MALPQGTTGSTMPRRQLGRHLRDLRNRARMTTRTAAQQLEWSEAKIWRIETGQTSLRSLDVEAMCKVYGAPSDLIGPLTALARETKARGWWTAYGDVIAEGFEVYIGLEEAATRLSTYENELVPGLLQTEDYTRALLTAARPDMPANELDRRVQLRMARQALVTRANAPLHLDVVISESVLWRRIGGDAVTAAQLEHLRRMCDLPNVRIQVAPTDSGYHDGMDSGRFVMLEFPELRAGESPEPPVVYVESFTGPVYLDKENEIDRYRRALASIKAVAVDARDDIEQARSSRVF
ncbi:helix-turn-helix domain-containing protein [Nocardia brasiliensis]|uniref:helix-turn-helix domain-containing protein n=1 Tax=Nocardia brasiliensis TaxID=37326 RepID=UPI0018937667|nr:helix-turn-helix transcriptional regulator [Nocardia brasiliensis]MBF6129121.1 helix-turn-helix domain-containing protein [Nocardia brasiliensis]MBF6545612.1 helix-turn-helix domain-containing protein [Nocardia brasiliensis]